MRALSTTIFTLPSATARRGFVVYLITNLINGKRYIGKCSRLLTERMGAHLVRVRGGSRTKFHNALRKHEPSNFSVTVLAACVTHDDAYALEQRLISTMRPEYNLTDGGKGTYGRKMEQWQKDQMSRARMGNQWGSGQKLDPERQRQMVERARIKCSKRVMCVETGETFPSIAAAARAIGLNKGCGIERVIDDPSRTRRGLHFVSARQ